MNINQNVGGNADKNFSDADVAISYFEPLLRHCINNTKLRTVLAEAYAQKKMYDKSLSYYRQALDLTHGDTSALQAAIAETTLNKLDAALEQLDAAAPDYPAKRERLEKERLTFQQTVAAVY